MNTMATLCCLTTGVAAAVLLGGIAAARADDLRAAPVAAVAEARAPRTRESFTVATDIGHTPGAPGARSARGRYEYEFNKRLAGQLLTALLAAGFKSAFVINPNDEELTLLDRTRIAAERKADLFLSIHHDSVHDSLLKRWTPPGGGERPEFYCDLHRGYGIFCSSRNPRAAESVRFARLLGRELLAVGLRPSPHHTEKLRGEWKTLIDPELGIYEYTNLVVVKTATMPAALLECGVIVHREEELELNKPERQERTVNAIVRAVIAFAASAPAVAESVPAAGNPEPTTPRGAGRVGQSATVGARGALGPRRELPAPPAARGELPPSEPLTYEPVPMHSHSPRPAVSPSPSAPP